MTQKIQLLFFLLISLTSFAQQEPQYSQYMYNMSAVNPAYVVGKRALISGGVLYRQQWSGLDGAPKTANAFTNIPLSENIEISLNYVNDQIGDAIAVQNNYYNIDFAYVIKLANSYKLSFGLKGGVNAYSLNASSSNVASDLAFSTIDNEMQYNLGLGAFYFNNKFYAGLSSSNLLPSDLDVNEASVFQTQPHLYLISGYVYSFSQNLKLKPSIVIKQVLNSATSFDVSLNSLLYKKFEAGISYRYNESFIGLAAFNINNSLKVGYAYDFGANDLGNYNSGTHEFMLLFNLDLLGLSKNYTSPRFF